MLSEALDRLLYDSTWLRGRVPSCRRPEFSRWCASSPSARRCLSRMPPSGDLVGADRERASPFNDCGRRSALAFADAGLDLTRLGRCSSPTFMPTTAAISLECCCTRGDPHEPEWPDRAGPGLRAVATGRRAGPVMATSIARRRSTLELPAPGSADLVDSILRATPTT
jgi:hypothetical protein